MTKPAAAQSRALRTLAEIYAVGLRDGAATASSSD